MHMLILLVPLVFLSGRLFECTKEIEDLKCEVI
jgi:hypothetical protein